MKRSLFLLSIVFALAFSAKAQQIPNYNSAPEAKEKAKQKLQEIKERIKTPEDFYKQALLYSDDPGSNRNNGCYDSIKRGEFVPEFEKVALSLKPGEISDVFETKYGFHIMLLRTKRENDFDVCHILVIPTY